MLMVSAFLFRTTGILLIFVVSSAMGVVTHVSIPVSMSIWKSLKRLRLWMR